jgi:hypothetical protein
MQRRAHEDRGDVAIGCEVTGCESDQQKKADVPENHRHAHSDRLAAHDGAARNVQ